MKLNDKDWTILIITSVAGGLIAFGLVILVQWLQAPNLVISVGSESPDQHNPPQWKIIHIKIVNSPKKFRLSPLNAISAFSVKGKVTLSSVSDKLSFFGKWASTPQPLSLLAMHTPQGVTVTQITNPNMALLPSKEDIHPAKDDSESVQLAVAIKFDGDSEFYGFSNESYLDPNLKKSNLKLNHRSCSGTLLLSGGGIGTLKQDFKISNRTNSIDNFHLTLKGLPYN